jgi:hypothetical protein
MRGSKYVQSDLYSVFFDVKEYIKSGRKVLFTGTPCQVAGLHKYLGGKSDRLVTVDIACHGVPGPGLWEMYVKALGKRAGSEITAADFRDKSKGWRRYGFKTVSTSGTSTSVRASEDPYMALFMQDMTLRPSCYNCPAKGGRSCSDLTVADLWSVARTAPQINDDRGASGVLVNTHAGIELLEKTKPEYRLELSPNEVMSDNGGFAPSVQIPERRVEFFEGLKVAGVDVYRHMSRYVKRKPLPQRLMRSLRSTLSSIKRRVVK